MREREDVKRESEKTGSPVHLAELMALCFLKNAELEKALQKYKGRLVLRGTTSEIKMVFTMLILQKLHYGMTIKRRIYTNETY